LQKRTNEKLQAATASNQIHLLKAVFIPETAITLLEPPANVSPVRFVLQIHVDNAFTTANSTKFGRNPNDSCVFRPIFFAQTETSLL
jgi:hypothetical protein